MLAIVEGKKCPLFHTFEYIIRASLSAVESMQRESKKQQNKSKRNAVKFDNRKKYIWRTNSEICVSKCSFLPILPDQQISNINI